MDAQRKPRLSELMDRMGGGDSSAAFLLVQEFGTELAGAMRRHLRAMGTDRVARDDLDGLVIDAALALYECASAWRPDVGALPWNWAGRRLRGVAAAFIGQYADSVDGLPGGPDRLDSHARPADPPGPGAESEPLDLLGELATTGAMCRLVNDALYRVGSPRDARILLEVRLQATTGDPSPAVTVGAEHGMRPDAVRQVTRRMRARLRHLADSDERFEALAGLALVA